MKHEFNDEALMHLGRMVAALFDSRHDGLEMIAQMVAEGALEEGDAEVDEVASSFVLKGEDDTRYELVLRRHKTEEERALEGMPDGTEYLGSGLYAVPDDLSGEE